MQELLQSYRHTVSLKETLSSIQEMAKSLNTDAYEKEQQEETKVPEIKAIECFDADKWDAWSNNFEKIVKACAYPGCVTARLSKLTYDAVVNGKHKSEEGKGYRAFLNSIILFSLMKTLEECCAYRPAMLILDSPILTLKERKKIMPDELASPGMRESLFQYFVDHCGDNQVIIIENEIPESVNYGNANLIEFTQYETGRYGFMRTKPVGNNHEG